MQIKVLRCMDTLSREATLPFSFWYPSGKGPAFKEKNLLSRSKFFFKSRPLLGRVFFCLDKQIRNKKELLPFEEMAGKHGGVPIHLKMTLSAIKTRIL